MIAQLEMELGMLKDAYEDSDRQDPELRAAIRKTKAKIKALKTVGCMTEVRGAA